MVSTKVTVETAIRPCARPDSTSCLNDSLMSSLPMASRSKTLVSSSRFTGLSSRQTLVSSRSESASISQSSGGMAGSSSMSAIIRSWTRTRSDQRGLLLAVRADPDHRPAMLRDDDHHSGLLHFIHEAQAVRLELPGRNRPVRREHV